MLKGALIVAMTRSGVIGQQGQLPWHLPDELQWFKQQTLGRIIIMGARTFESLHYRPLKGRENWVLSHHPQPQVKQFNAWSDIMNAIPQDAEWVAIGGASVYRYALPHVSKLYVTWVEGEVPEGDVFFPEIDWSAWQCQFEQPHAQDERHDRAFTCCIYDRIQL